MQFRITPQFFAQALEQEKPALRKMVGLVDRLTFAELVRHKGVHWEKLSGLADPQTGEPLYSLRITLSARATAVLIDGVVYLLAIHVEHDQAYRRQ